MRKKYDSAVIFLYNTGNEHLLPAAFRKTIPWSTITGWRKIKYDAYIGHEYRAMFDQLLDNALLQNKYKEQQKLLRGILRAWLSMSSTIKPLVKKAGNDKKMQKYVLRAIDHLKQHVGPDKALRVFGVSKTLYQQWILESRFHCFDSFSALCVKRHPHQLEKKEVTTVKKLLTNPTIDHWPIVSVASHALREKKIVACLYTWYKYARLLDISKKPVKKDRKTIGIVAKYPNEYLHVDCTYYPIINGNLACIAIVMDNYSKRILGYHAAEKREFTVVKKALEKSIAVIVTHPDHQNSFLVADGGTENHNKDIDGFLTNLTSHKITKIRALKDIRFSNCPIEAVHRTLKGRYLRNRQFESLDALDNYLSWAVNDYNYLRPHYKHKPLTPNEVYFNIPLKFNLKNRMKRARHLRINHNKCAACIQCTGIWNQN